MKLLIIEDDLELLRSLAACFRKEGFTVETAAGFDAADEKIALYDYDCVIIDILLPGGNGLDLVAALKKRQANTGIIITSGRRELEDKLAALDMGADDYLTKPYHLSELNARVKSVIRRRAFKGDKVLATDCVEICFDSRNVTVGAQKLVLTRKEFDLMVYFATNIGKVMTREMLVEYLWGDAMGLAADSFDFIYTHIKNLRRKLKNSGCCGNIKTIYGVGYKYIEE